MIVRAVRSLRAVPDAVRLVELGVRAPTGRCGAITYRADRCRMPGESWAPPLWLCHAHRCRAVAGAVLHVIGADGWDLEDSMPLTKPCGECGGAGVVKACTCSGGAHCPNTADRRCAKCDGTGIVPRQCDAYTTATRSTNGCAELAEGRCPRCSEALCEWHLARHRDECGMAEPDGGNAP